MELKFENSNDDDISNAVCHYLISYINNVTNSKSRYKSPINMDIASIFQELSIRNDFPVIVTCSFYQILFAHFFYKKYNTNLTLDFSGGILFSEKLDNYQFSLPYEDQVTCSYFVFRYLYTPEEREKNYKLITTNKFKKTSSFDNFLDNIAKLHITNNKNPNEQFIHHIKLYSIYQKLIGTRNVLRNKKQNEKYGFNFITMLNQDNIENYIYDALPYDTINGFHCTILLSELKKEIDFANVIKITAYYVKAMSNLNQTLKTIDNSFVLLDSFLMKYLFKNYNSLINHYYNVWLFAKCNFAKLPFKEDVFPHTLSLMYIKSIASSVKNMQNVFSFLLDNIGVINTDKYIRTLYDKKYSKKLYFDKISEDTFKEVQNVIQQYWPDLLPTKNVREKFMKIFSMILDIEGESKSDSYNHKKCTLRFFVSMVLVFLLADKELFSPLPEQCYYHMGKNKKIVTINDLLKTKRYSVFKNTLLSCLFQEINMLLEGETQHIKYVELGKKYYDLIQEIICCLKYNPIEDLHELCRISYDFICRLYQTLADTYSNLTPINRLYLSQ